MAVLGAADPGGAGVAPLVVPPVVVALGLRLAFGPLGMWPGAGSGLRARLPADLGALDRLVLGRGDGRRAARDARDGLGPGAGRARLGGRGAAGRGEPSDDLAAVDLAGRPPIGRAGGGRRLHPDAGRARRPLLFGLRRTLAFTLVEAATGPDPAPRAAVLALLAVGLAVAAQALVGWWGGPPVTWSSERPNARPGFARGPRAAGLVLALGAWAVVAWLPTLAVLARSGRPREVLTDPISARLVANATALGLAVVRARPGAGVDPLGLGGPAPGRISGLAAWPERLPPLALGVGALVLPGLLALVADSLRANQTTVRFGHGLQVVANDLDPDRLPGLLLALAVAAVRLPYLARTVEAGRGLVRPLLADAAITLGAPTPRRVGCRPAGSAPRAGRSS